MKALLSCLLAAAALASVAAAGTAPKLAVADRAPLAISGSGFPHATRVVITVHSARGPVAKTVAVRSSSTGRFTAQFPMILVPSSCRPSAYTVTAKVASRVRATIAFSSPSRRDCAQPVQPIGQ